MLFAIKLLFFALSALGLIACWVVFFAFSKSVGSRSWTIIPLMYTIGTTVLQGIFCLGVIWRMDPYLFPSGFCLAQVILFSLGSFFLTGIMISMTIWTTLTVFGARAASFTSHTIFPFEKIYLIPIAIFPIVASAVQITFVVRRNAARPNGDDMHCDASAPGTEWIRLLGYAGVPLVVCTPFCLVAVATMIRLFRTHWSTSRDAFEDPSLAVPTEPRLRSETPALVFQTEIPPLDSHAPSKAFRMLQGNDKRLSRGRPRTPHSPTTPSRSNFNTSLVIPSNHAGRVSALSTTRDDVYDPGSPTMTLPVFASRSQVSTIQRPTSAFIWPPAGDDNISVSSRVPADVRKRNEVTFGETPQRDMIIAIWRLAIFQLGFFLVEILAGLTSIIDVASNRPTPTEFGSQHVALLLSAWGPALIFGHVPAVRQHLMFWRRQS